MREQPAISIRGIPPQPRTGRALAGKTAIVTGSTSGIGLGTARAFAAAGMNVVLNGLAESRDVDRIRSALIEETGADVVYSAADMSKPDDIAAMAAMAAERFGLVDVLRRARCRRPFPPCASRANCTGTAASSLTRRRKRRSTTSRAATR